MRLFAAAVLMFQAVETAGELKLPVQTTRQLATTPHTYLIAMHRGQALIGSVEQRGIDVVIALRDPGGTVVFEMDSPNGSDGPEPIAWIAPAEGRFVLEIRPFAASASGGYELNLEALRAATARDRSLVDGLGLYQSAFRDRGTALRLQAEGQFAPSIKLYRSAREQALRALALRNRWPGSDSVEAATVHQLLGLIDDEIGDYRSGEQHFQKALRILETRLGAEHPGTMTTRSDLGYLRSAAGNYDEAEAIFESVITHGEKTGVPAAAIGNTLIGLGETLSRTAKLDRAETVLRRAIGIRESTVGLDHPTARGAQALLGLVLVRRGAVDEGHAICTEVESMLKRSQGSEAHQATAISCLAEASLLRGDCIGAIERAQSVLRIRQASYGPDGPPTAEALTLLGRAQAAGGHARDAKSTLTRAYDIQKRRLGTKHPSTLKTLRALEDVRAKEGAKSAEGARGARGAVAP